MNLRPYQTDALKAVADYKGSAGLICMPTGTGKSRIIAGIAAMYSNDKILCLTHVKELVKNNCETFIELCPYDDVGVFSAGLRRKQIGRRVTFAGIGSVVNNIEAFSDTTLIVVDEAHLIPPKGFGNYQKVLAALPKARLLGLTATPYRMGQGSLTDNGVFHDNIFDVTQRDAFTKLIDDGYLCNAVTYKTDVTFNLSYVGVSNGDFSSRDLDDAVNQKDITSQIVGELVRRGAHRKHWIVFASGVKHAQSITTVLQNHGVSARCVSNETPEKERDSIISSYKKGEFRAIVNHGILTTGFDFPAIDLVAMLRPTMSPGLWVQMVGRGLRPSPQTGKENCLILDFGRNTERLGPVNDPIIPKGPSGEKSGPPPIRVCPECMFYMHAATRVCPQCGYLFPVQSKLQNDAATLDVIVTSEPQLQWFNVDRCIYTKQISSSNNSPMLKVTYVCGGRSFNEFVLLEHSGVAQKVAQVWWKKRMGAEEAPPSVVEALGWTSMLYTPKRIQVWTNKKPYPVVKDFEF